MAIQQITVFGGSGFVGRAIVQALAPKDFGNGLLPGRRGGAHGRNLGGRRGSEQGLFGAEMLGIDLRGSPP